MANPLYIPTQNQSFSIQIFTLGQFYVQIGDKVVSEENPKSKKLWELFMYFVTNHRKKILPETLQEIFWTKDDLEYSQQALKTLIYRLRQNIKKRLPLEADINPILFSHGCYLWNPRIDYWLDIEKLEDNYTLARQCQKLDPEKALIHYQIMFDLYKGSFLQEMLYTEWTIAPRNYYRRLYLQGMKYYIEILNAFERFSEVTEICYNILQFEPHEEEFFIYLISALLQQDKILEARKNYEHITSVLYHELGIKPSAEMRNLYNLIKSEKKTTDTITEALKLIPNEKPLICDKNTFISIIDLERRKAERRENTIIITFINLSFNDNMDNPARLKLALEHSKIL